MADIQVQTPPGVDTFNVVCRLGAIRADGADTGSDPDLYARTGTVTVRPSVDRLRLLEPDGRYRSVDLPAQTYDVDATGELQDAQGAAVHLIHPDSAAVSPQGWSYAVDVKPAAGTPWTIPVLVHGARPDHRPRCGHPGRRAPRADLAHRGRAPGRAGGGRNWGRRP